MGDQIEIDVRYRVTEKNGWSYVVGDPTPEHSGPWRYRWEAQEYADELNQAAINAKIAAHRAIREARMQ